MASAEKQINILLVGGTQNGKSATGNSISMHRAFKARASSSPITQDAVCGYSRFEDTSIAVVDTLGVGNTECTTSEGIKLVVNTMTEAVSLSPKGFHAILIVIQYKARFTQAEIDTINILKRIFGESFITYHAILCLTRGDKFVKQEGGRSVVEWCNDQTGDFAQLYAECGKRVILFDNRTNDRKIKENQLHDLLNMINKLMTNAKRYTSDIFQKVHETREAFVNDPAQVFVSEDIMKECGLINEQLLKIVTEDPEENLEGLTELQNRVEKLEKRIFRKYRATKVLPMAKIHLEELKTRITIQMKLSHNLITEIGESQKLKDQLERTIEQLSLHRSEKQQLDEQLTEAKIKQMKLQNDTNQLHQKLKEADESLSKEKSKGIFRAIWERIKRAFTSSRKGADMRKKENIAGRN